MVRIFILSLTLLLTACGFQLRGAVQLPFKSIHIALPGTSEIGALVKRQLRSHDNVILMDSREEAEAIFVQTREERLKNILSITSKGLVSEYQLVLRYGFRVTDAKGQDLTPPSVITLTREITFADSAVLAKAQEEQLIWRDMLNDLTHQILRRMAVPAPKRPVED